MVRLDEASKDLISRAADLRRISVSDYVRLIMLAEARSEVAAARERSIRLSRAEQLEFWRALEAPAVLTRAQKRLGALMRGDA
jgi:uncharacterized protein (DUF1778 family)